MPSSPPQADPAPRDGSLPRAALEELAAGPFGIYLHVPFCRVRCGYCDFNTYTPAELADPGEPADPRERRAARPGTTTSDVDAWLTAELDLARRVLGDYAPRVETVFIGGGTPTMLTPTQLGGLVHAVRERFGLAYDAEVTTEANPDTVDADYLRALSRAGFTRVSLGMQSSVSHVLRTLDRTHRPANVKRAVDGARAAGLAVSLDLIYGTPGESLADWRSSLRAAIALRPDHLSAYALTVEPGTKLAGRVRRGEVPAPDDDDEADKYELAQETLADAGYGWYEVSNWARSPSQACRHNLGYWRGGHWWGVGPGAHSHIGGVRWWNVRQPARYAAALAGGGSPGEGRETLDPQQRYEERVMLGIRLAEGLPLDDLHEAGREAVPGLLGDGLLEPGPAAGGRAVLTLRGRLLADTVLRRLLGV
ncbi:radical SAM family heme chaperone HemW [Piscicoccus intestinalis]|uniref:radical SAM family heme chaperone HemW n=1 Tax=Piscicoccus intestinalis TaxID=746033 RepID=UPI0008385E2D|nr:radical SAM family heme chaperone HemW [Piscicoccus intestinalis]